MNGGKVLVVAVDKATQWHILTHLYAHSNTHNHIQTQSHTHTITHAHTRTQIHTHA